tara:strand:+ start:784 stop:942 length:159 start_codon:yes stop_codon:yes gene_type:complete
VKRTVAGYPDWQDEEKAEVGGVKEGLTGYLPCPEAVSWDKICQNASLALLFT